VNNRQRISYLGGSFSVGVFSAFNNYTMSLWLTSFTTSYVLIGMLGNSKSVEGSIVSPLAGYVSDRTWAGWLGRRRPFILVGGLLSAALLSLMPFVARLPVLVGWGGLSEEVLRLVPIVGIVFLFTLTFNMGDDLHKALRADLTEGEELNLLSSLATIVDIAAQVGLLVLGFALWGGEIPDWAFFVAGALVALGVLMTTFGVREPSPEVWAGRSQPSEATTEPSLSVLGLLSQYRGALVFTLMTFFLWGGVNAVLPLVSIFVRDILHASVGEAQLLPALLLLSTTMMAIPVAKLASRVGKRRVLAAGYLIMSLSGIAGMLITTKEQGVVLFLVAGIGNAAAVVLAIPMMAELVPKRHMGVATGLLAAAGSIAAPLASLVAGTLSESYGPRVIFAVMAVMVAIALLLLFGVRAPRERLEVTPAEVPTSAG